jgi:hypothetical protein
VESTATPRRSSLLIGALTALLALAGLLWWGGRRLQQAPPGSLVAGQLPLLELRVQFVDLDGTPVAAAETRLGDSPAEAPAAPAAQPDTPPCPELVGGDTREAFELPEKNKGVADGCPRVARWVVKRHPVAFSCYVRDGKALLAFLDSEPAARAVLSSPLVQGLLRDPLHGASLRGEDLNLEGIQGAFLTRLLREALQAQAELHYDLIHGRKGVVFSFVRDACPFAAKALPLIAGRLARSGYRLARLEEPVLELRLGLQRLFVAQHAGRVYLANGLEGLLNVLESAPATGPIMPATPLVATLRAEAFMGRALPPLVGEPTWHAELGLGLSSAAPGELRLSGGRFAAHLRPAVFRGVLASIPRDCFAGVTASLYLPPEMDGALWRRLASEGPATAPAAGEPREAGVALLWDLSAAADGGLSHIGVAIANPEAAALAERYRDYFADVELTADCGGGTVFLAASTPELLARMRESCAGQSLSVLDWTPAGELTAALGSAQLICFLNPAVGLRQSLLAGGAKPGDLGPFEPRWKEQVEQAKRTMRQEAEAVFERLPLLVYAGPAAAQGVSVLPGRMLAQEGWR